MAFSLNKAAFLIGITLLPLSSLTHSHEYWLDPIDSMVAQGDTVIVDIRNGQDYAGAAFPYDPVRFQSITVSSENTSSDYTGRLGDYPAIHFQATDYGLHSVSVETKESSLVYDSWSKFTQFLNYHGLTDIEELHLSRQLPKTDITERYFRSAKTLIDVTSIKPNTIENSTQPVHASLQAVGSVFEMTPLTNPYAIGNSNENTVFSIRLTFDGKPLPARQVEMFWKGSQLIRLTTITNEKGVATFQLLGNGDYMLNAVQVITPESANVHWVSYWASLTFEW